MKHKSEKMKRFRVICQDYVEDIFKVFLYITRDKAVAQDITEKTFVEFYKCFEEINPDCWYAYLVHIAKTMAYDLKNDSQN